MLIENGSHQTRFSLDKPGQCLVPEPDAWHLLRNFRHSAIVLMVSNDYYDPADYICTKSTSDRKVCKYDFVFGLLINDL